jgi:hypothetical protein
MNIHRLALPTLALVLTASGFVTSQGYGQSQEPQTASYGQASGGWDTPPQEFQDIQRQGFHDGIEGARKDYDNHRQPNVRNRDEYRHPPVSRSARNDYRAGFSRGYDTAMSHLATGPR